MRNLILTAALCGTAMTALTGATPGGAPATASTTTLTGLKFDEIPLNRVFQANVTVTPFGLTLAATPTTGFVIRQITLSTNDMIFAVDGPAVPSNPLAYRPLPNGASSSITLDPPVVVPPGSNLNLSCFQNAPMHLRGYFIYAGEL